MSFPFKPQRFRVYLARQKSGSRDMNRRELFVTAGAAALAASLPGRALAQTLGLAQREDLLLSDGWRFHEGDIVPPPLVGHDSAYNAAKAGAARGAASPSFDDTEWQRVTVPHDFASFQPISQDDNANVDQGYRKRGIAWYRNVLKFEDSDRDKHIELQIEGAATWATVWFNGTLVDRNWSGYSSAYIDLTPYVTYGEVFNSLVIRVDASAMEGWWYEGAGLYRDVRIVKRNPVHIITDGVFAHPVRNGDAWTIPVEVTLNNSAKLPADVTVTSELRDGATVIAQAKARTSVAGLGGAVVNMSLGHAAPRLWSPDDPQLYAVVTRIKQGDTVLDEVTTTCGFREQRFDANSGFFLNGQHLKIKGVCLHQDHAGVGTAMPEGLIDFRLRRLKTLGCNAIRCSHNAQSRAMMDACDRLGFLVMAENRDFDPAPDYMAQLQWLVRRDRNHPCVYLWSVFNEEPMQGTEAGYEMVRRMSAAVKALDTTRPVTAAMNGGLDAAINVSDAVDVIGINYQQGIYDEVHARHPDKPIFSSEDTSSFMTRGAYTSDRDQHVMAGYDEEPAPWGETHRDAWQAVNTRDFIAGTFVWTGLDYHGEPTPFTWPSNSSFFGILDLCGFDKSAALIHRAQWIDNTPYVGVAPHWNWKRGDKVRVMACSNCDEIELFVNHMSYGRQAVDRYRMNYWDHVDFSPGFIEVRAFNGKTQVAVARSETAGPAVALRLTPDRINMDGDGRDAQPVTVEAVDAQGRNVPLAQHLVTFEITGGTIIGLGNGNPNCLEAEKGYTRSLFNGLAQVIVQADNGAGGLRLRAGAEGLKTAQTDIGVASVRPVPTQATAPSVQMLDSWFRAPAQATAPDPSTPVDTAKWSWFRPADSLFTPLADGQSSLCATSITPFAGVQKEGGVIEFLSLSGACDVYVDGQMAGSKEDDPSNPLTVNIPAGAGERHIAVIFHPQAGQPYGFGGLARVRMAQDV